MKIKLICVVLCIAVLLMAVTAKRTKQQVLAEPVAFFESRLNEIDQKKAAILKKFAKHGESKKIAADIAFQRKLLKKMKRLKPSEKKEKSIELIQKQLNDLLIKKRAIEEEEKSEIMLKHPGLLKEETKMQRLLKLTLKGRNQYYAKQKSCSK
mmetsp:Transcript_12871/g.19378  ORF Transcript_12871/g.19378 Transcript_12871/m.19378 type:complete len:153 (-) Transcript_12871:87-545(-)